MIDSDNVAKLIICIYTNNSNHHHMAVAIPLESNFKHL